MDGSVCKHLNVLHRITTLLTHFLATIEVGLGYGLLSFLWAEALDMSV